MQSICVCVCLRVCRAYVCVCMLACVQLNSIMDWVKLSHERMLEGLVFECHRKVLEKRAPPILDCHTHTQAFISSYTYIKAGTHTEAVILTHIHPPTHSHIKAPKHTHTKRYTHTHRGT